VWNLAGRRQDAGAEDLGLTRVFDQAELDAEPAEPLEREDVLARVRCRHRSPDQGQQLGVVVVHQRRDMSETVVNHVWIGGELWMGSVTKEQGPPKTHA